MSDKKYHVFNENEHEYDLRVIDTDEGTEYNLYRSHAAHWSEHARGELELQMIDTGNGVIFHPELTKVIDYGKLLSIAILSKFNVTQSPYYTPYTLIEVVDTMVL